jgi:hypothetical protein
MVLIRKLIATSVVSDKTQDIDERLFDQPIIVKSFDV